jgi:hypothetical protein
VPDGVTVAVGLSYVDLLHVYLRPGAKETLDIAADVGARVFDGPGPQLR